MSVRLKSLVVEDFRSIRGRIQVPLDAPVILVHGPNGAGKTSFLSAIETALIGASPTLERVDPDYVAYLPHKDNPRGTAALSLTIGDAAAARTTDLSIADGVITGAGLLSADDGRFFTERCYLGQSTLGRLLEIYQHQDAKKTDSALTRFVKEILGLGALDALIEGLHPAGDVRRLKSAAPAYWSAREDVAALERSLSVQRSDLKTLDTQVAEAWAQISQMLAESGDAALLEGDAHLPSLNHLLARDEAELTALAQIRRDLSSAANQLRTAAAAQAGTDLVQAEALARTRLESWQTGLGASLQTTLAALTTDFPELASVDADVDGVRDAAERAVSEALQHLDQRLADDVQAAQREAELAEGIAQGRLRLAAIDAEIAETAGDTETLASALSRLEPHIHSDTCPVCQRDFAELGKGSLAAQLAGRIQALVETTGRLQALSRDRAATLTAVSRSESARQDLTARRIPADQQDQLKHRRVRLAEQQQKLQSLTQAAREGAQLRRDLADAARILVEGQSRQTAISGFHDLIAAYAEQLGVDDDDRGADLGMRIDRLMAIVAERDRLANARQAVRRRALALDAETTPTAQRRDRLKAEIETLAERAERLIAQKMEADRRIETAKGLAARARSARTAIVRRVFNEELNMVWRELFIRLAPDEPFVPAFALPEDGAGAVEATLETHYRAGGLGGNPRTMLSAGNLNTAALTLFLALHFSVQETLPWLIIDDPVQSMDEVHIAQFAALLRTLAKQQGRQVVIAVHERTLFDYLSLELSPAFIDDRLITVELGRTPDGRTTAAWDIKTYEPDRAIAA